MNILITVFVILLFSVSWFYVYWLYLTGMKAYKQALKKQNRKPGRAGIYAGFITHGPFSLLFRPLVKDLEKGDSFKVSEEIGLIIKARNSMAIFLAITIILGPLLVVILGLGSKNFE